MMAEKKYNKIVLAYSGGLDTSVLIPWNTCGMTQATILGVATFTYLPYCFFNLISPLMSITIAAIGFKIKRKNEKAESVVAG